jgi:hypothetical protein
MCAMRSLTETNDLPFFFKRSQVEAYGPDPTGIQRKSPDHGSSIPGWNIVGWFR